MVPLLSACGSPPAAPAPPAQLRTTPPPWDAPGDDVAYIAAAGLQQQPVGLTSDQHLVQLSLTIDGQPIALAGQIGIDQGRAVQAQVHTHDASGKVWLEGRDIDGVTLGQFFTLWGVRFTDTCVGAACGTVLVTTEPALDVTDPRALVLKSVDNVAVTVVSKR
jgi:hypothetical protein